MDECQLRADKKSFPPFTGCAEVGRKNILNIQYKCHDGKDKTEVVEDFKKQLVMPEAHQTVHS